MSLFFTIAVSLAIFGMLIVAHELGHFLAARLMGVEVEEFSMGMGPLLWQKRTTRTKYSVRLFPIGGYCLMRGEDEGAERSLEGSINAASPLKRIFVFAAGAAMNFLAAILVFFLAMAVTGTDATTTIELVEANSPAQAAGLKAEMQIHSVNGRPIAEWAEFSQAVFESKGANVALTASEPGGQEKAYAIAPAYDEEAQAYRIGVAAKSKFVLWHAVTRSVAAIGQYIVAIIGVFGGVFTGRFAFNEVFSGPIGVTAEIGRQIASGVLPVLFIAGAISVSLGFFNLLPLPALDGSRIAFAVVELVKGSPVSRKWEGRIHYVGFIILMLFAAIVAYSDISKLL
jgi:regulator of sigma E protease